MQFHTALVVVAVVSAVILLLQKGDRLWPLVAVVAAGIEALLVFGLMSLSLAKFRIDVILPALLVLSGAMCWHKTSTKPTITASAFVTLIGTLQLLLSLRVFN